MALSSTGVAEVLRQPKCIVEVGFNSGYVAVFFLVLIEARDLLPMHVCACGTLPLSSNGMRCASAMLAYLRIYGLRMHCL